MPLDKQQLIARLQSVFREWNDFLADRPEAAVTAPLRPGGWSTKDVVAHLLAWQQVSVARLEAALHETEPELPDWLAGSDPFYAEEHTKEFNARILEKHKSESWQEVLRTWRDGFLRFLQLGESLPGENLLETGRYPWLRGHALAAVLEGSCDHHEEHLRAVKASLGTQ